MTQRWDKEYESYIGQLLVQSGAPGMAVSVSQHGQTLYEMGLGYRDKERGLPMRPDTVIGIGSVTKSMTAVAIMQLQERGKLSVHDPVVKYLPRFRTPKPGHAERVTIHHLLTHTAGLPSLPTLWYVMLDSMRGDPAVAALPYKIDFDNMHPIRTLDEFLDFLAEHDYELLGEPGQYFSYSNDSWALLGNVVEAASGQPYTAFVEENVLQPAGMTRSTFDRGKLAQWWNVAQLYAALPGDDGKPAATAAPGFWDGEVMYAAGFLCSTVADMTRYLQLFTNGGLVDGERLLSEASVAAMSTMHVETLAGEGYGYGLQISTHGGHKVVEHGGGIKGGVCMASTIPDLGVTAIGLASSDQAPVSFASDAALNVALRLPVDTKRAPVTTEVTLTPEELDPFVGEYVTGEGARFVVARQDDSLTMEIMGQNVPLRAIGNDTFAYDLGVMSSHVRFHRNEDGSVRSCLNGYRIAPKQ